MYLRAEKRAQKNRASFPKLNMSPLFYAAGEVRPG